MTPQAFIAKWRDNPLTERAKPLAENMGVSFRGTIKNGAFDIPGQRAREWLKSPNPNGRPNSEVIKPWMNGKDILPVHQILRLLISVYLCWKSMRQNMSFRIHTR